MMFTVDTVYTSGIRNSVTNPSIMTLLLDFKAAVSETRELYRSVYAIALTSIWMVCVNVLFLVFQFQFMFIWNVFLFNYQFQNKRHLNGLTCWWVWRSGDLLIKLASEWFEKLGSAVNCSCSVSMRFRDFIVSEVFCGLGYFLEV